MERKTVDMIKRFIKRKRAEAHIVNAVVRDDVFSVLQKECIVLYYALDDSIDGCHMQKPLLGELRQFVFEFTAHTLKKRSK